MLKKSFVVIAILISLFLFVDRSINVNGSTSISSIECNVFDSGDNVFDGENSTITITNFTDDYLFYIINENTSLYLKNVNIVLDCSLDSVFYVSSGCSLTLENVNITTNVMIENGITNLGVIDLKNVHFSEGFVNDIVNNSSENNCLNLHLVDIEKVLLNSGYISVYSDSEFLQQVEITLNSNNIIEENIGKVLVKGVDVVAEFFIDDFYLTGCPNKEDYYSDNYFRIDDYIADITNNFYLDYVGDVNDGIALDNGYTINTGDIILTKFSIYYTNGSDKVYVAGKYCTAHNYLLKDDNLVNVTTKYYSNGEIVTGEIVLNDYTSLIGIGSSYEYGSLFNSSTSSDMINCSIIVKENNTIISESMISLTAGRNCSLKLNLSKEYLSINVSDSDVSVSNIKTFGKLFKGIISVGVLARDFEITINVKPSSVELIEKELILENDTFNFSGNDLSGDISLYYLVDNEKIYLTPNDYEISKNDIPAEFIEVGEYVLTVTKTLPNIIFTKTSFNIFIVNNKLQLFVEGEYVYNKLNQKESIKIYYYLDEKVYLNCEDFIVTKDGKISEFKNAGEYEISVTKSVAGYEFLNSNINIVMEKKIIDTENEVKFLDKIVSFDGNHHTITPTGINEDLLLVEYLNDGIYLNANDLPYEIKIKITPIDILNYAITKSEFVAKLTILKINVDMSGICFDDKYLEYSGDPITNEIEGVLPNRIDVEYEYYLNDNKIDYYPVNVGNYKVIAKFINNNDNNHNYNNIPDMISNLIILPKEIDCGGIVFESCEVYYDGEYHNLYASSIPSGVSVSYVYLDSNNIFKGAKDIGEYKLKIIVTSLSSNYTVNNFTKLATLKIIKGYIDMSGVTFNDVEYYYDGKSHSPEILGTLPHNVKVTIEYDKGIFVGEYRAYAHFTSTDMNYNNPDSMTSIVKILPKPLTIKYDNHYLSGINKYFKLSFDGIVGEDKLIVSINYTKQFGNDGTSVIFNSSVIGNKNYTINNAYNNKKFYISDDSEIFKNISANLYGEINSDNNFIKITEESKLEVHKEINHLNFDIKSYDLIKISGSEKNKDVVVTFSDNSLSVDIDLIKIFTSVNGKLVEKDYTYENGMITINCSDGDMLVIVMLDNHQLRNVLVMCIYLILAIASIAMLSTFSVIMWKKKRTTE